MCPIRWTVRTEILTSIADNYEAHGWKWSATKYMEMRSHIGSVDAQMQIYFGLELGRKVLNNMVDNLFQTLQSQTMSVCEGQRWLT